MALSTDDTQVLIDRLFERLEDASSPASVNQFTHSLRLHITTKHDAGLVLSPREQALVDALGFMRNRRRSPLAALTFMVLLVLVLGAVAYAVWRYLPGFMP